MARTITRYKGSATVSATLYTVPSDKVAKIKFITGLSGIDSTDPGNKLFEDTNDKISHLRVNKGGTTYTLLTADNDGADATAYILPGTTSSDYITLQSAAGATPSDVEIEDNIILFEGDYINVVKGGLMTFTYDFYVIEEDT